MTKEKILNRKKDLKAGLEGVIKRMQQLEAEWKKLNDSRIANINAIRECDHWLSEYEKEEKEKTDGKKEEKKK